jgi:tetratricopeptide (TPR) repeat protein
VGDASSGLHYEPADDDALSTLRRQARSLSDGLHVDVDRPDAFAVETAGQTDVTAGLLAADDPAELARRLSERGGREPDLRLRRLVDRADRAIDRGDLPAALALVDEALGLDRTSATVWLLKGRCLLALADFTEARRVIAVARRYARDEQGVRLADAAAATCHREEMRDLSERLAQVVADGDLADGLLLIRRRLEEHPDDSTLLQHLSALLMDSGDLISARQVAESALRRVNGSNATTFEDLLRRIAQRECEPRIDDARAALRRGDTATATARLGECVAALGDNANFAALRSYAMKRHIVASTSARTRRLRGRRDDSGPMDGAMLQPLIEWLVQEELDAGRAALNAERFAEAQREFAAAAAIDDRCALVEALHAEAIFRDLGARLENGAEISLSELHGLLVEARRHAVRCLDDSTVGTQGRRLFEAIEAFLSTVNEARARVARIEAVQDCISRYNTLAQRYSGVPMTLEQRDHARWLFDQVANEVRDLQRAGYADAQEEAVLRKLDAALSDTRTKLRRR